HVSECRSASSGGSTTSPRPARPTGDGRSSSSPRRSTCAAASAHPRTRSRSGKSGMADFRDPALPLAARVERLLADVSLEEKLAQLGCVWSPQLAARARFAPARARTLLAHGIGQITRIGASTGLRPAESAAFANAIQRFLREETRLGIPAIIHEES